MSETTVALYMRLSREDDKAIRNAFVMDESNSISKERRRSEMARTKRKVNPILPVTVSVEKPKRVYQAGGYVRLSVEDSGKPGADTIINQRGLI